MAAADLDMSLRFAHREPFVNDFVRCQRDDTPQRRSHHANMGQAARNWFLREWRDERGLSQEKLAADAGTSKGYLSELERGIRKPTMEMIERLADALAITPTALVAEDPKRADSRIRTVPLVGYVGAGSEAHFYATGDEGLGEVEAPPDATSQTRAAEIRGESLGPLFEHWLVYYDDVRTPVTPDLIGKLCILGLPDDRVLVKKMQRSRTAGLYHLLSNNEAPMLDQEVVWAAKVKTMRPR